MPGCPTRPTRPTRPTDRPDSTGPVEPRAHQCHHPVRKLSLRPPGATARHGRDGGPPGELPGPVDAPGHPAFGPRVTLQHGQDPLGQGVPRRLHQQGGVSHTSGSALRSAATTGTPDAIPSRAGRPKPLEQQDHHHGGGRHQPPDVGVLEPGRSGPCRGGRRRGGRAAVGRTDQDQGGLGRLARTRVQASASPARFFRRLQPPAWRTKAPGSPARPGAPRWPAVARRRQGRPRGGWPPRRRGRVRAATSEAETRRADDGPGPRAASAVSEGSVLVRNTTPTVEDGEDLPCRRRQPEVEAVDDVRPPGTAPGPRSAGPRGGAVSTRRHPVGARRGGPEGAGGDPAHVPPAPQLLGSPAGQLVLEDLLAHVVVDGQAGQHQALGHPPPPAPTRRSSRAPEGRASSATNREVSHSRSSTTRAHTVASRPMGSVTSS